MGEFGYRGKDGKLSDTDLHDPILDNPEADRVIAQQAVRRAIEGSMISELARLLYGLEADDDGG